MSEIILNTKTLRTYIDKLENYENYYENKKSSFTTSAFGNGGKLSSYLSKIQTIYGDISKNLKEVRKYLDDYISDAENIENRITDGSGYMMKI